MANKKKARRGIAAALVVAGVALALGASVALGHSGEGDVTAQAGADLVVVPEETTASYEGSLLGCEPSGHYLDGAVLGQVESIDGVERASAQTYLGSSGDDCCGTKTSVIAFDPNDDFSVQALAEGQGSESVSQGGVLVGSKVLLKDDSTVELFGVDVPVAARLEETGTSLDESAFGTSETLGALVDDSASEGNAASAVFVRVRDGADVDVVRAAIESQVDGVRVVASA